MYIDVLVELKSKKIDKTFTYIVPENLKDSIKIGIRVYVPFGSQKLEGFVLNIKKSLDVSYDLKSIISIIDEEPVLNHEMLELGKYISKKTMCNLISAYQTMLPVALKAHSNFVVNKKYVTLISLKEYDYIPKNQSQKEIINILKNGDILKSELSKISISSLNTLLKKGIVNEIKKEDYRLKTDDEKEISRLELTKDQLKVVESVTDKLNSFSPFLLHGVTGSGKTEVYLNIIENILNEGKEVIVLVPEISLTPQMVSIFKNRFKDAIAILHSKLSDGEKYDEWRKIQRKEVSIVIGARSAIFAPLTNIGLIILDEEHSDTYKQDNNPKYNAIDIAIYRAKKYNCPLILGSATPSIESYTRAKQGIYNLLELKNRINKTLPKVSIIDMRNELKKGNSIISEMLYNKINDRLKKDEQVLLLLNRRGYSTVIECKKCGNVLKCPNCDIALTYHKNGNKLNCHYCNYTTYKPYNCPSCLEKSLTNLGIGTEKLEEEIKRSFIKAKTIRMDIDTTRRKGSHEKIINDFKNKKYNVLIGTQMISKGLDFSDVTLVGVINGDTTLNIPDYRSGERTFSLLCQVAGRSGRSEKFGEVIIQCFNTDHYSISCAKDHNYNKYYTEEMSIRKKLKYPPYFNLCLLKLLSTDYNLLLNESNKIKKYLNDNINNSIILGPSPGTITKIYNKYNMQIIIKYKNTNDIYEQIKFIQNMYINNNKMVFDIDFNPKKI